uniref:Uncharacterized protein n=1 Tax=Anguilla anguilla TaxID=7936 RepID=A0A0E9WM91_ANGAN
MFVFKCCLRLFSGGTSVVTVQMPFNAHGIGARNEFSMNVFFFLGDSSHLKIEVGKV